MSEISDFFRDMALVEGEITKICNKLILDSVLALDEKIMSVINEEEERNED